MGEGLRIYNLFPTLVGPITSWAAELPRIAAMAFNAVYLNPFHYPGASGSIYAIKDYYQLNPNLRGKSRASGDALLRSFIEAAAGHGLRVIMDLVVNHTAKDSDLVLEHPDWFLRDRHGEVVSPGATDPADPSHRTVWRDLAELDYAGPQSNQIATYFEAVVRHYAGLGFGGFRCDAAYKVPAAVWRRLIAAGKEASPDILFCAENLGAPTEEVLALRTAGFDYLFNSVKWWDFRSPWLLDQYELYRRIAPSIGFPESHDTERLAIELLGAGFPESEIEPRYRQAYAFAAMFSAAVMMPVGYEYGWSRRLEVVARGDPEPEAPRFDLSPFITEINRIKGATPALNEEGRQRRLTPAADPLVVLQRQTKTGADCAFIVVNTDGQERREIDCGALAAMAGLGHLGDRLVMTELWPAPGYRAPDSRLVVAPLEVRLLRADIRPAHSIAIRPCSALGRAAGHHPLWNPDARIVIENVTPEIDGGRYPAKRIVGEPVEVQADMFRDGHDTIAAVLNYAYDGEAWQETPFEFFDNDRWVARFAPDRIGRWRYTIEAWTDRFASWRDDFVKKRDAGQALDLEVVEGRVLVAAAVRRATAANDKKALRRTLADFDAGNTALRAELLLSGELRPVMRRAEDRSDTVRYPRELEIVVERVQARCAAWYEMFPRSQGNDPERSATFDDCIERLGEIAVLGFDVVYLAPIHPIGRINRKGRDNNVAAAPGDPGSPYAIGSAQGGHRAVNPELGTLADFRRFVGAAAELGIEVALDFAIQCAPDHPWVEEHKRWFRFRPDGSIKYAENPPKKYEDIVNVDFYNPDRQALWDELRDTVLFWVGEGVRIFRVDNPHTKPLPFWEWMIGEVKAHCPEVIFLAEAFTRPKMMQALAKAGFTQSYTYFTWRNTKGELTEYLTELTQGPGKDYFRPNFFTNTPDILPVFLQEGGRPAFRIRLALAATLSPTYGIYNGFELCENTPIPDREEYLHSEKYQYKVWDWDRPGHIKDDIARLNQFRRANPALQELANLRFIESTDPNILAYVKATADRSNVVLVAVNLDPHGVHAGDIVLPLDEFGVPDAAEFRMVDAFTGISGTWRGARHYVHLDPHSNPVLLFRLLNSGEP